MKGSFPLTLRNPIIHHPLLHPSLLSHLVRQPQQRQHTQANMVLSLGVEPSLRHRARQRSVQRGGSRDRLLVGVGVGVGVGGGGRAISSNETEENLKDVVHFGEMGFDESTTFSSCSGCGVHGPGVESGLDGGWVGSLKKQSPKGRKKEVRFRVSASPSSLLLPRLSPHYSSQKEISKLTCSGSKISNFPLQANPFPPSLFPGAPKISFNQSSTFPVLIHLGSLSGFS